MWYGVSLLGFQMTAAGWFLAWHEPGAFPRPSQVHIRLISKAGDTLWRFDHYLPTHKPLEELSFFATDSVLLVGFLATANTPGRNEQCTRMFIWKITYPEGTFERLIPEISPQGCLPDTGWFWGLWRIPSSFQPVWINGRIAVGGNMWEVYVMGDWGEVWSNSFVFVEDESLYVLPQFSTAANRPAIIGNHLWFIASSALLRLGFLPDGSVIADTVHHPPWYDPPLPWSPVGVLGGRWVFVMGQQELLRLDDWNPENLQVVPVIPPGEPYFVEGDFVETPETTLCGVVRRGEELWLVRLDTAGVQTLLPTGIAGVSPRLAPHLKGGFWLVYWYGTRIQHARVNPRCNTVSPLASRHLSPAVERAGSHPRHSPEFMVDLLGRRVRKLPRSGVVFQGGTRRLILR